MKKSILILVVLFITVFNIPKNASATIVRCIGDQTVKCLIGVTDNGSVWVVYGNHSIYTQWN